MEIRWMKYKNENGEKENFYPVTHAQAIVYGDDGEKTFADLENDVEEAITKSESVYSMATSANAKANIAEEKATSAESLANTAKTTADEAVDAINNLTAEDVGAIPIIDAKSANYDMDVIIAKGHHFEVYETNENTLGTPYKKGNSTAKAVTIFSYGSSVKYGIQFALQSGNITMQRKLENGVLSDWSTGFLPLTGGTLNGDVTVSKSGQPRVLVHSTDTDRFGQFYTNSSGQVAIISSLKSDNKTENQTSIVLAPPTDTLANLLRLNKQGTVYKVYGEHNKPTTSDVGITAGTSTPTSLADGAIYLQY